MKFAACATLLVFVSATACLASPLEQQAVKLANTSGDSLNADQLSVFEDLISDKKLLATDRLDSSTINAVGLLLRKSDHDDAFQQRMLDDVGDLWARIGVDVDAGGFAYLFDSIELSHGRPAQFGAIPKIVDGKVVPPKEYVDTARDRIGLPPSSEFYAEVNRRLAAGESADSILVRFLAAKSPHYPTNPKLRHELIRLVREDQSVRNGKPDPEKMKQVDADVHNQFVKLVDHDRFPEADAVGRFGVMATWLIIQHQIHDPTLMKRFLVHAKKSMERGELPCVSYALLLDRVRCYIDGEPQIYGTQPAFDGKRPTIAPVTDVSTVNASRAKMFMAPIDTSRIGGDCKTMASQFQSD